ncbi:serine hydrolase [uncultured Croceitalea sp.]|uniref:serine hydrolase n=1 Tax=uncultured Croceitalea sp. TaxID=1798908 RepID=UPI00374F99CD
MKHFNIIKLITIYLYIVVLNACNPTKNQEQEPQRYVQTLDSVMQIEYDYGILNGSVLVAKNDTIVYEKTFGHTDADKTQELDKSTIFNIGSIAKEFNGVAIMMLQEQRLLHIDDPISKFDLELPTWSEKIKIKHLLNYASGLPMIDFPGTTDEKAWEILRTADSLAFEPGTQFRYTNSNVFLQRRIVEKVTGQTFQAFVIENMIKPLKLTTAVFDPSETHADRAFCYDKEGTPCPKLEFISGWPWLNARDLYKWITAMNTNLLISQESFDVLLRNPYAPKLASSLGEYFEEEQLQRHDGTSYGFRSIMLNDFKNQVVIIMLLNNTGPRIKLGHMVHDIVLEKAFSVVKNSVYDALINTFNKDVKEGLEAYTKLKQNEQEMYAFDDPSELNKIAYVQYREQNNVDDAIKVLNFAVIEFPENANLYDSLGEMYLNNKQHDLAIKNYKKAIALGGTNGNAKKMITKIQNLK